MGSLRRARKIDRKRQWAWRSWLVLALVAAMLGLGAGTAYADPPTAYPDGVTTQTDQPVGIFLSADDLDGDPLTYAVVAGPSHGVLSGDCTDGDCTYTPNAGFTGADSFTWKANDGTADSNIETFTIDVVAPGAPTAYDNSVEAGGDETTTLTLSGEDDAGADLTFAISTPPSHGTLSSIGTPSCDTGFCEASVDYTPTAGYRGPDHFEFTVSNATLTSAPGSVDVSVVNAPCTGAVVANGTVKIGVNCSGDLNVGEIGLRYVPTDNDSTAPGCACEGWGVADATTNVSGYANESRGTSSNLSVVSFDHDADSATSVVDIGSTFRVTHDYQPSTKTPNVYDVAVSVKNTSAAPAHLRYRRVMDWDIEPTAFDEFVTVDKGTASEIVFTSDNGFATADPLAGPSSIDVTGNFTDSGPNDHGALFDFDFGTLAAGETKTFQTYYGAAATETGALDALNKVDAEAYSLGEPSTPDGPTLGTPNTFLFAFGSVGGAPIFSPVANDDTLTTNQGTAGSKNVLANDTDPNGDTLSVTAKTDGAHGTVSCTAAGVCTYTPTGSYTGPDSFTYTVDDGHGGTDVGTVTVTVTPVAHPPVATDDTLTTPEDTAGSKNVLTNDTDADGDTLSVTAKTNGAHGTVSCTAAGVCTYTPAANYNGPDSFTYTVSDGHGGTDTGTVNVTVTPVNDPPVAAADTLTTPQATAGSKNVLANDTDADGDTLSVTGKTDGAHGTVSCTAAGVCTYTPTGSYTGPDSFTYTASDGHGGTATGTVSVTVTAVNHPPVATGDTLTTPEDTAATKNVLTNDTDSDGDTLSVTGKTDGAHGTVTCLSTGACTYTPAANYNGPDSFTYTVSDGHGGTATATVSVTVTPVNDPPVATADTLTTAQATAGSKNVLANDTDVEGDALSVTAKTDGAHGTVSCTAAGVCTYTPTGSYTGPDSFTYTVSDGHGGTATATVTVTVNPVAHPPVATDDTLTTPEDTAATKNVLTNDTDADGDTLTVTGKTNGAHGTVTCLSTGACTYTPTANYNGADAFTYTVSDGHGGTATGNVMVTVTPVNDPPVAVDDTLSTAFETAKTLAVLANDTDADGDLLTVTAKTDGAHGTVSCTVGGSCTYTPAAGYSGPDSFTYTANDTHGGTDVGSVSVTVAAKPSAPDVSVVKSPLAASVGVGNLTGYSLTVHNGSGVAAPTVSVSDALPTGFRMRDASGQPCVLIGNTLTCSFALAAGETRTVVVNGAFVAAGTIANTATVSSAGDPNPANDSSRATTVVTGKTCTIVGTFGDDNPLLGTNKADVICGLSGNDRINGKQGNDTIYGNDGNDRLNGLGGNDLVDGGPGTDTVTYGALQQSVRVNLGTHKATGQGADTFVSIENAAGSPRADVLVGDGLANRLDGGAGNDVVSGGAGADTLVGGSGKDTLRGGSGNDRIVGGSGKDSCSQGTGKGAISC